jgi:hypothetical protein
MATADLPGGWDTRASWLRTIILGGLISLEALGLAAAQTAARPPVGGIGELPDAMIFYVAHGAADACGPGCSDWIAAEGRVEWDTLKRLIAILDRQAQRSFRSSSIPGAAITRSRPASAGSCAAAASTPLWERPKSKPATASPRPTVSRSSVRAAAQRQDQPVGAALRYSLRPVSGRWCPSQPATGHTDHADRQIHQKSACAQHVRRSARRPQGAA